jgi:periplasmic protein TonB
MSSMRGTIFASIGLHAFLLVLWGIFPVASKLDPKEGQSVITIALMDQPRPDLQAASEPAESPAPSPAPQDNEPPVRGALHAEDAPVRITHAAAATIRTPWSLPVERPSGVEPSSNEPAVISFLELPRSLASGPLSGTDVSSTAPALMDIPRLTDEMELRLELPQPPSRPVLALASEGRILKDMPDIDYHGRSKVKMAENTRPDYPRPAREAGWEGTVMVRVEVMPDGTSGRVRLQKSSGHPVLDDAALSAVQRWRFVPAVDGQFPVRALVDLPIRFDLRDGIP